MTEMEQFIREGSEMMVKLPALRQLETKISSIESWKGRLADVFHLSSPNDSLVPVCTRRIACCMHMIFSLCLFVQF